jgi:hypothetical protein
VSKAAEAQARLEEWYAQDVDADPQPYPAGGHLALDVLEVTQALSRVRALRADTAKHLYGRSPDQLDDGITLRDLDEALGGSS